MPLALFVRSANTDAFNWTKPKVIGECPPITRAHTAVLVDKRIFIIGGGDGPTYYNETYYFDTGAFPSSPHPSLPLALFLNLFP